MSDQTHTLFSPSFGSCLSFTLLVAVIASHQSNYINATCFPTFIFLARDPVVEGECFHWATITASFIFLSTVAQTTIGYMQLILIIPHVIHAKNRNRLFSLSLLERRVSLKVPATWIQERMGPFISTTLLWSLIASWFFDDFFQGGSCYYWVFQKYAFACSPPHY